MSGLWWKRINVERFLLDTHIWIWLQEGDRNQLKRSAIEQAEEWHGERRLHISAISVWEIAQLATRKRIALSTMVDTWIQTGLDDPDLTLLELSPSVLVEATRLPGDIHKDPADRMIVATARHHGLTLLTRDDDILTYAKQGHVRVRKF
jgi:PIN domain nuclease of toxin-antitoxin system